METQQLSEDGTVDGAPAARKGRYPIKDGCETVQFAVKVPADLKAGIWDKSRELRRKGWRTSPSHLVRTLVEYTLEISEDVFSELYNKAKIKSIGR